MSIKTFLHRPSNRFWSGILFLLFSVSTITTFGYGYKEYKGEHTKECHMTGYGNVDPFVVDKNCEAYHLDVFARILTMVYLFIFFGLVFIGLIIGVVGLIKWFNRVLDKNYDNY